MRKKNDSITQDVVKKQKDVYSINETLRSKLDVLKKFEKEMYEKLANLDEKSRQKIDL
jgi:hypothetical protein